MPKALTEAQVAQFASDGYLTPIDLFDRDEVARYRQRLRDYETQTGGPITGAARSKTHLLFTWVDEMMRDRRVVDLVEDLIGPDILCWNTLFWIKQAGSASFVSWHQDARYWGLSTDQLVTVWVALSDASEAAGCMRVLPGSHRDTLLPHRDEYHADNLLTRGQQIDRDIDENEAVTMPLTAGQVSLHNVRLAHASGPNTTAEPRIGMSFHYMPTDTVQEIADWDSAALIRGEDRYHHFTHTPRPAFDMDPATVEFHQRASDVVREIVFSDAAATRPTL